MEYKTFSITSSIELQLSGNPGNESESNERQKNALLEIQALNVEMDKRVADYYREREVAEARKAISKQARLIP